jgi:hypothetical protein
MGAHVTIIDERDHVGWAASATRVGELTMTSVANMVDNIIGHLSAWWRPSFMKKMRRLNILDHGNASGMEIGDDWVTAASFGTYSPTLGRLCGYFHQGAFVHLQHCEVGQNIGLMTQLADLWQVPVVAGRGFTNPVYRFNTGNYVRVYPLRPGTRLRPAADTFFWGPDEQ